MCKLQWNQVCTTVFNFMRRCHATCTTAPLGSARPSRILPESHGARGSLTHAYSGGTDAPHAAVVAERRRATLRLSDFWICMYDTCVQTAGIHIISPRVSNTPSGRLRLCLYLKSCPYNRVAFRAHRLVSQLALITFPVTTKAFKN